MDCTGGFSTNPIRARGENFCGCRDATIAALVCLFGVALFPIPMASRPIQNSLTIYNSASSHQTLVYMTVIAVVGMPFVVTYTCVVYWSFRGKVRLHDHSYWRQLGEVIGRAKLPLS